MKKILSVVFLSFFLTGCPSIKEKTTTLEKKALTSEKAIQNKQDDIQDKGKSYVFGAKYSIGQVPETNRVPAVKISEKFIELAQLTLGSPSIEDANKIREIADGLLAEAKLDVAQSKAEATKYRNQVEKAEAQLTAFNEVVVSLEKEKEQLIQKHDNDLKKLEKVNEANATKAAQWNDENSFLNSINPFHDLFKFAKKMFFLGLIVGLLILVFRILEIFFPALNIVSAVFGMIGKLVMKLFPAAKKAAGLVSEKVYDSFKSTVQGLDTALNAVKNHPIEADILSAYPKEYKFTYDEVYKLLEKHSENIEKLIKTELDKAANDDTRGLVQQIKSETGIKSINYKVQV